MSQIVKPIAKGDLVQSGTIKVRAKEEGPPFDAAYTFVKRDDGEEPERKHSGPMPRTMSYAVDDYLAALFEGRDGSGTEFATAVAALCKGRVCVAGSIGKTIWFEFGEDAEPLAVYFSDRDITLEAKVARIIEGVALISNSEPSKPPFR